MIAPSRYYSEPRLRKAYCEAFDLITIYGVDRKCFDYKRFGLNKVEMKQIWAFAQNDAEGKSKYDVCFG